MPCSQVGSSEKFKEGIVLSDLPMGCFYLCTQASLLEGLRVEPGSVVSEASALSSCLYFLISPVVSLSLASLGHSCSLLNNYGCCCCF